MQMFFKYPYCLKPFHVVRHCKNELSALIYSFLLGELQLRQQFSASTTGLTFLRQTCSIIKDNKTDNEIQITSLWVKAKSLSRDFSNEG
jgi:hypothetical protein